MDNFLTTFMQNNPILNGGLMLMLAGWLGYQLRELPGRLLAWIRSWTTRIIQIRENHPHYDAWLELLTENAVRPGGPRTLEVRRVRDPDNEESPLHSLAAGIDAFWARVMGKWCRVIVHREQGTAGRVDLVSRCMITLEIVLGTRADIDRLSAEAARRADVGQRRQIVNVYDRFGNPTSLTLPKRSADTLCLPANMFASIEKQLRDFCAARDAYETAGLPWRFGVLLSGPPGTGKTSLAHALASHLSVRLAVINLGDLHSDCELLNVFRSITDQSIVLIEDVDCAFKQRQAEAAEGISFAGFLNCIDGVMAPSNGRILVMSTNHPERLDPALVRPGRVDLNIAVPTLGREQASDYVDRVFPHVAARHDIVREVLACEQPTPAMLINRLMQHRWHPPAVQSSRAPASAVPSLTDDKPVVSRSRLIARSLRPSLRDRS